MELAFEGTIINTKEESFPDKTTGEKISFFKYTIAEISGDVSTFNSKKDFTKFKGKSGVIYVTAREQADKNYKLSIADFQVRGQERTIE